MSLIPINIKVSEDTDYYITAEMDAKIYSRIIPDGIIKGSGYECEIQATSDMLTIKSGLICIQGYLAQVVDTLEIPYVATTGTVYIKAKLELGAIQDEWTIKVYNTSTETKGDLFKGAKVRELLLATVTGTQVTMHNKVDSLAEAIEKIRVELPKLDTALEKERERISAEEQRKQAESQRVSVESVRVQAESTRTNSERLRTQAETLRVQKEQERINAELQRSQKEQDRVSAESQRVSAESSRTQAETNRSQQYSQIRTQANEVLERLKVASAKTVQSQEVLSNGNVRLTFSDGSSIEIRKGQDGKDGVVTFEALTPQQKAQLKGDKGDPLRFQDLTLEQKNELKGQKGDPGQRGTDGRNGSQGAQGVSVVSVSVDSQGRLVFRLSNGQSTTANFDIRPKMIKGNKATIDGIKNKDANTAYFIVKG